MKVRNVIHHWKFHLGIATALAIIIRSIPGWLYAGWGNDFGIYYSITIKFLAVKNPFYDYPVVWGSSGYGSFPMLYMIILVSHYLTGLSPHFLLLKVPPIIGGLSVVPLYFISYELTKNRYIALFASLLLAINPVHVYQTSMPYFLTVGHFFLLTSLYFFIKWQKSDGRKRIIIFLSVSSLALLFSHHLTNYIYIISAIGISFVLALYNQISRKKIIENYIFIAIYSGITFAYWLIRVPGMIGFMESPFHFIIPWYIEIALYYFTLLFLLFISLRIRLTKNSKIVTILDGIKVRYIFAVSLGFGIIILLLLAVVGLHGYYLPFISILYSIPFMLTIGFMGVGLGRLYKNDNLLYYIGGWLGAIVISAFGGLITWAALEPWRHIEYMMEPLSITAAYGVIIILKQDAFKKTAIKTRIIYSFKAPFYAVAHHLSPHIQPGMPSFLRIGDGDAAHPPIEERKIVYVGKNMQIAFISIIIFIILMTGFTAFPFMNSMEVPPKQEVSYIVMSGINWLAENGDRNYTVATDHKIGTILAAYGFNSSFEYDYKLWNYTDWKACIWELLGLNGTYPRIGYVLISMDMFKYGVYGYKELQNPLAPPVMMSNKSYEKFKHEPFELIFENHTQDYSDWVEIYRVNWTYISENLNLSWYENAIKSLKCINEIFGSESNALFTVVSGDPSITFYSFNGKKHLWYVTFPSSFSSREAIRNIF